MHVLLGTELTQGERRLVGVVDQHEPDDFGPRVWGCGCRWVGEAASTVPATAPKNTSDRQIIS